MARSYTFRDLATYSGASKNEVTNWVQKGLIRPDVKDTSGTGDHRTFGFLDVFEACVVRKLNQIPGGMPLVTVANALSRIRFETVMGNAWALFLDPQTRNPSARFWLCMPPAWAKHDVLDSQERDALLNESADVLVMVRLDTLLIELEQKTQDHSTAAERGDAWMKRETSIDEPTDSPIEPRAVDTPSAPAAGIAAKAKD